MSKSIYEICEALERAGLEKPKPEFGQKLANQRGELAIVSKVKNGVVYVDYEAESNGFRHFVIEVFYQNFVFIPTEGDLIRAIAELVEHNGDISANEMGVAITMRGFGKFEFFDCETLFENLSNAYIWAKENLK